MPTKQIGLRIDVDLLAHLTERAEKEHRTLSNLIFSTLSGKSGKWIPFEFGDYHWHKCSVCGIADQYIITTIRTVNGKETSTDIEAVRNFCPNCGADMRG